MACGSARDLISLMREQVKDDCTPYRYSDSFFLKRINLALRAIYPLRPDAFEPELIYHKLEVGADQFLPKDTTLREFQGTGYKQGNTFVQCDTAKPTENDDTFLSAYANRCPTTVSVSNTAVTATSKCDQYAVKSVNYERKNGNFFGVVPAVPVGVEAYIKALVYRCPDCTPDNLDAELPCKFYNAIYEKSMALVYGAEGEDQFNDAKAKDHEARFAAFLNGVYVQDQRIRTDEYLGAAKK